MIKFSLQCDQAHGFESWFASGASFETQQKRKLIDCPVCGSTKIEKQIMAPSVRTRGEAAVQTAPVAAKLADAELRQRIRDLHTEVAAKTENVGDDFADQARKMHSGEIEDRAIRGRATLADAKDLLAEGVPVLPLPPLPDRLN